jgi:hypothetical protein
MFLEGVGLGEGIVRAALVVARAPLLVYRLFVLAAGILIVPLLVYWAAIMFQNVAISVPELSGIATSARLVAELVLVCGVAAFAVMLHATFFAYYAWTVGGLEASVLAAGEGSGPPPRSLEEFVPASYEHVAPIDEVLGPWHPDDVMEPIAEPEQTKPEDQLPEGPFDLKGILRVSAEHRDEEE